MHFVAATNPSDEDVAVPIGFTSSADCNNVHRAAMTGKEGHPLVLLFKVQLGGLGFRVNPKPEKLNPKPLNPKP